MKTLRSIVALMGLIGLVGSSHADLQVTITPGYVFGSNERADTSKLNRLGMPTATITGTIGGTNASLSAGSVNSTHLADAIPDGTNLVWRTSPRTLGIIASGVDITQLSSNVAGIALSGGSGSALRVDYDTNTITLNTNGHLTLNTNLPVSLLNVTSNYVVFGTTNNIGVCISLADLSGLLATFGTNLYTSYSSNLAAGVIIDTAHNLGATPRRVRAVLVCQTTDCSYAAGDEVDAANTQGSSNRPAFEWGANSTNVFAVMESGNLRLLDKSTGSYSSGTLGNWKLKIEVER